MLVVDRTLLQVRVGEVDDLGEEVVGADKRAEVLPEQVQLVLGGFVPLGNGGVVSRIEAGLRWRHPAGERVVAGLQHVGLHQSVHLGLEVDLRGIELGLEIMHHVRIGDALECGLTEVGLEGREDLVGVVDEVQDKGLIFADGGAVQSG